MVFTGKTIAVIGGGRWSRVHISVLEDLLDATSRILWITDHGHDKNLDYLAQKNYAKTSVKRYIDDIEGIKIDGLIVATRSHTHEKYLRYALEKKIPALIEKPFALSASSASEFVAQAEDNNISIGSNLEFLYASYLQDFKSLCSSINIKTIECFWHDPFSETRYGETKYSDICTPIAFDQAMHIWSLLHVLGYSTALNVEDVQYRENSEILISARHDDVIIKLSLFRRAQEKQRKIVINDNELVLDFAPEPGTITTKDKSVIHNQWRNHRPMSASLSAFLKSIDKADDDWPAALRHIYPAIPFCEEIDILLQEQYQKRLSKIKREGQLRADNQQARALIIDMFAPQYIAKGERVRAFTEKEQTEFADLIIRNAL